MTERVAGRVVLITGAGRGFGAGIARGLARANAHVCITDVNADELAQTERDLRGDGADVLALPLDVCDAAAFADVVERCVERWGRLDALISNAAILPMIRFEDLDLAQWQRIIDVNLTGVFNGTKAAWHHMRRQGGGHLIAIASGASVRGSADEVAYCAAKHGLEGMTKALAIEAEPCNIAVNTIGPGAIIKPTNITRADELAAPPEVRARWADPLDLAPAFAWLIAQPPQRFTGLRFDAAQIAETMRAEGFRFAFTPEKTTLYVHDMRERIAQRERWTSLSSPVTPEQRSTL